MELDFKAIGTRVKRARLKRGLSQEQLAEKINMSPVHVSHVETGITKLSLMAFVAIANALEMSADELLGGAVYCSKEVLHDDFARMLESCDAETIRLMLTVCEVIKQDTEHRKELHREL